MKAITNLDSILQSRDMTLLTKVCIVKSMSRCELDHKKGWVLKNWCFQTWCWRRLLRFPWKARRYNQSILKEVNPKYSLERRCWCWSWISNTLATWCEEPTHWKGPWCWERLKAGEGGDRGWDGWMTSLIQWTWVWANSRRQGRTGKPGVLCSMGSQS